MTEQIKININDAVKVKLTGYGIEILKQREKKTNELIARFGRKYSEPVTQDDYYECSLWKLFSVFGEHMFNGGRQVFCDNAIEFKKDNTALKDALREALELVKSYTCNCDCKGCDPNCKEYRFIKKSEGLLFSQSK